ncbi:16S rRNA (cytidine(1402)-2'-O)-methyltransferase [Nesterenkonia alba]|uniref:16S rRNA (cytidine(1402)-2'-O)-methyltransferase n=1 Tax=Nesterenkonia alba TaxID=515814 RepID=UPI0003B6C638|nr:16S rRNA (cytidine(1402)-2'-O)-methyltransferase [Nesterenkonia alba]
MDGQAAEEKLWAVPVVLAATPIGNLADATCRLTELIRTAEVIACEDTRRTRHLISALGISTHARLVSLHEHNEASRSAELIAQARSGTRILVVSDAGTPGVSDPGHRLVTAAIEADLPVTAAPGASAVTTALVLSGLPTAQFTFAGFPPRKVSERRQLLNRLETEQWTTVLFESPHRVAATLGEMSEVLGSQRRVAVARELTKRYEEILRGGLGEVAETLTARQASGGLKGEFVIVLAGAEAAPEGGERSVEELAGVVVERAAAGERMKDAAKQLAAEHGVPSRELYAAATALRHR